MDEIDAIGGRRFSEGKLNNLFTCFFVQIFVRFVIDLLISYLEFLLFPKVQALIERSRERLWR
jgi:hypothetical protein